MRADESERIQWLGNKSYRQVRRILWSSRIIKEQVMELLLGIALKTISNYLDHISPTPLDHALAAESK